MLSHKTSFEMRVPKQLPRKIVKGGLLSIYSRSASSSFEIGCFYTVCNMNVEILQSPIQRSCVTTALAPTQQVMK